MSALISTSLSYWVLFTVASNTFPNGDAESGTAWLQEFRETKTGGVVVHALLTMTYQ